ncbi:MAG: outer membrane lipoprotein carrier protein LolA [Candidatus Cloacimonadota bacterium]|nr:outer membrane lipoprotein carrier protein LolA [Candidatus Cloacimonadota bacterium]
MKNKTFLLISIILFANYLILSADSLLDSFLERNERIRTFQADFEQRNLWPELEMEKSSLGKVFTKGNNIRLEYSIPNKQLMIGTEKELIFYFPEQKQLIKQDANYWQLLLSPELLAKEYLNYCNLKETHKVKGGYLFIFSPTEEMNDFKKVMIMFSDTDSLIIHFEYEDKYNNAVEFSFSNQIINRPISDTLFSFPIPDSVNVIDQRIGKEE